MKKKTENEKKKSQPTILQRQLGKPSSILRMVMLPVLSKTVGEGWRSVMTFDFGVEQIHLYANK